MTVIIKIKPFRKGSLRQDELQELFTDIVNTSVAANFADLNIPLNLLQNALNRFQMMIHPVVGSEITPEIAALDEDRDKYYTGLYFYVEYAVRHYDPAIVAAGKKIQNILNMEVYASLQREAYRSETAKIVNLLEELRSSCANAVATLNLSEYLQTLENANLAFRAKYQERNQTEALYYTSAQIREARTEMEQAFDTFKMHVNMLAQIHGDTVINPSGGSGYTGGTGGGMTGGTPGGSMGGGSTTHIATSYTELINLINDSIDHSMEASKHRLTMQENAANNNENGGNADNGGNNNQSGETPDPNQGEDNTPSANA